MYVFRVDYIPSLVLDSGVCLMNRSYSMVASVWEKLNRDGDIEYLEGKVNNEEILWGLERTLRQKEAVSSLASKGEEPRLMAEIDVKVTQGLFYWLNGEESACWCRRHGFSPWSGKDLTCRGANKLIHHNYWTCPLVPRSCNYWTYILQLLNPAHPRACALQREKPPQWEAHTLQLEGSPYLLQLEQRSHLSKANPAQSKIEINTILFEKRKSHPRN